MPELQRVRKVLNWLIFSEYANNDNELAQKLGYTKSSFSQIINGKVPLSDKFVGKICEIDKNINKVWIKTGEGDMLKINNGLNNSITYPSQENLNKRIDELETENRSLLFEINDLKNKIIKLQDTILNLLEQAKHKNGTSYSEAS
jgi:transcriptional regulator with XRE-family HTH domain